MPTYSLSVWLDPYTASALHALCKTNERKKSDMVKVLIRKAARELTVTDQAGQQRAEKGDPAEVPNGDPS